MLLAIPVGLALGWALRGRLDGLSRLGFHWAPLAIGGLLVQIVLFSPVGNRLAGGLGPSIYVASTAAVFVAVGRNWRIPGMWIAGLGALGNLTAITVNGGFMPADAGALAVAGFVGPGDHTNSVVLADPVLRALTDIYALPAWVPLANVFSVGDVLIGIGVVAVIALAMARRGGARD
jgi:hypothetical protein